MEWADTGNGTMRMDYSNYIYGIISTIQSDGHYRAELFNCGGFECKKLASRITDELPDAKAFLDAESKKYQ